MRPTRIIAAIALAAAVAATGSYLAVTTTTHHPSTSGGPTTSAHLARRLSTNRPTPGWRWTRTADALNHQPNGRPAHTRPLRRLGAAGIGR